eukprot:SAG31_NODE_4880_length_2887_cov_3.746413_2_plen_73_part_00
MRDVVPRAADVGDDVVEQVALLAAGGVGRSIRPVRTQSVRRNDGSARRLRAARSCIASAAMGVCLECAMVQG